MIAVYKMWNAHGDELASNFEFFTQLKSDPNILFPNLYLTANKLLTQHYVGL